MQQARHFDMNVSVGAIGSHQQRQLWPSEEVQPLRQDAEWVGSALGAFAGHTTPGNDGRKPA
eukprot:6687167-Prorocentrum_lima.AAC.1